MRSIYQADWITFLSSGIPQTHFPTDLHNNRMTSWGQGGSYSKWRNGLCFCYESNPEKKEDLDLLVLWPTSIHQSLCFCVKAEQNHHLQCIQMDSKKVTKVEVNWTPTLESQKKEDWCIKRMLALEQRGLPSETGWIICQGQKLPVAARHCACSC